MINKYFLTKKKKFFFVTPENSEVEIKLVDDLQYY